MKMKNKWVFISFAVCSLLAFKVFAQNPLPVDPEQIGSPRQPFENPNKIRPPSSSPLEPFIRKRWRDTMEISAEAVDPSYLDAAGSPSGNAVVVWLQSSPDNRRGKSVWANFYISGEGWRGPELIEAFVEGSLEPSTAMDGFGNAVVVWHQVEADRRHSRIVARYYRSQDGWREPVFLTEALERNEEGLAGRPFVTLNHNGEGYVVWRQWWDNGRRHRIFGRFFSQGQWVEEEQIAETNVPHGVGILKLKIDSKGDVFALWPDPSRDNHRAAQWYFSARNREGGWNQPTPLIQDTTDIVEVYGEIPFLSSNAMLLVWGGEEDTILSQTYNFTSGLGERQIVGRGIGAFDLPRVVSSNKGNAFAIWPTLEGISVNRLDSRRGWGQSIDIAPQGENANYASSLATDSLGNAVVVWYRQQQAGPERAGELYDSWVCHYETNVGWKPATLLDHIDGGSISFYNVVRLGQDRFIAIGTKRTQDGRSFIVAKEYR